MSARGQGHDESWKGSANALMQPLGCVDFVALQGSIIRIDACEVDVLAEVISAVDAEEAFAAGDAWLYSDSIAWCLGWVG